MMNYLSIAVTAALLVMHPAAAAAQAQSAAAPPPLTAPVAAPPPLTAYAAAADYELVALSPDGTRLAFIRVAGEQRAIVVLDVATGATIGGARIGDAKVRDLNWLGRDRVLITSSDTRSLQGFNVRRAELTFGNIFDIATGQTVQVFRPNRDMMWTLFDAPSIPPVDPPALYARGLSNGLARRLDLYRIDIATGRGRTATEMSYQVDDYVMDASGAVMAYSEYDDVRRRWSLFLNNRGASSHRLAWTVDAPLDTPVLVGMGRRDRTLVVNAARPDLTPGEASDGEESGALFHLYEVDVDTAEWTRLSFPESPGWLVHHPRSQHLIGAGRMGEEGVRYHFIDEDAAARWASIQRAFPGQSPRLTSWSRDLRQIVVYLDGPGQSGVYHFVDFERRQADIIGESYPSIQGEAVAPVRPIAYAAGDGLEIHGYLTTPPGVTDARGLPLVVLAHGGPAARDVMGFDWQAQALASRGYAVLQANFRGSTGYGRAFTEAGYGEWGRKMQTDLSDGVRWLAAEGVIDPARVCIVGGSYGGYAALAGVTLEDGVYRCAVSINGVTDLRRMVAEEARQTGTRSSTVRYWNRFMGADGVGDRSLDARSPARRTDALRAPVLLIHGRDDTVVPIQQSRDFIAAARRSGRTDVELIELDGEDHWLSRAETRTRTLVETLRFLETHNPAR